MKVRYGYWVQAASRKKPIDRTKYCVRDGWSARSSRPQAFDRRLPAEAAKQFPLVCSILVPLLFSLDRRARGRCAAKLTIPPWEAFHHLVAAPGIGSVCVRQHDGVSDSTIYPGTGRPFQGSLTGERQAA